MDSCLDQSQIRTSELAQDSTLLTCMEFLGFKGQCQVIWNEIWHSSGSKIAFLGKAFWNSINGRTSEKQGQKISMRRYMNRCGQLETRRLLQGFYWTVIAGNCDRKFQNIFVCFAFSIVQFACLIFLFKGERDLNMLYTRYKGLRRGKGRRARRKEVGLGIGV